MAGLRQSVPRPLDAGIGPGALGHPPFSGGRRPRTVRPDHVPGRRAVRGRTDRIGGRRGGPDPRPALSGPRARPAPAAELAGRGRRRRPFGPVSPLRGDEYPVGGAEPHPRARRRQRRRPARPGARCGPRTGTSSRPTSRRGSPAGRRRSRCPWSGCDGSGSWRAARKCRWTTRSSGLRRIPARSAPCSTSASRPGALEVLVPRTSDTACTFGSLSTNQRSSTWIRRSGGVEAVSLAWPSFQRCTPAEGVGRVDGLSVARRTSVVREIAAECGTHRERQRGRSRLPARDRIWWPRLRLLP